MFTSRTMYQWWNIVLFDFENERRHHYIINIKNTHTDILLLDEWRQDKKSRKREIKLILSSIDLS